MGTPVRWTDNPGRRFCYPQCFWRLGEASTAETVKPLRASGRAGDLQNNNLTMGTSTMRKLLTPVMGIFTMLGVLVTPAEAATVSLIPGATQSSVGATVTLSIEGSGFTGNADGGAFHATWDATILQLVSVSIASPPWDLSFVTDSDPNDGLLDSVFVATSPIRWSRPGFLDWHFDLRRGR